MKNAIVILPLTAAVAVGVATPYAISYVRELGEKPLNLHFEKTDHVTSITTSSRRPKTNDQFLIECTFEDGWKQIDKELTVIKSGDTVLKLGDDYEINNDYQILIKAKKVTNVEFSAKVFASPTFIDFDYELQTDIATRKVFFGKVLCAVPNEIIYKETIKVIGTKGDGSKHEIPFGTGENDARLIYNYQDITANFVKNGFEFTQSMIKDNPDKPGEKQPTALKNFTVRCSTNSYSESVDVIANVGLKPIGMQITEPTLPAGKYVPGQTYKFVGSVGNEKEGGYSSGYFSTTADSSVAEIDAQTGILTTHATATQIAITFTSAIWQDDQHKKTIWIDIVNE